MPILQQGMLQQTPAVMNTLRTLRKADGTMGSPRGTRKRKRKTTKASGKRKRKTTSRKKAAPRKGSAAMKAKMAKLRKMRRKK